MILLLGADSYVGQGFARALRRRQDSFIPLSRRVFDYTRFEFLFDYVRKTKPELVINADECNPEREKAPVSDPVKAAAGTQLNPVSAVDPAERAEMLQINTLLPQTIARVCNLTNTAFGHVSSGSIYSGAKIAKNGGLKIEEDLNSPPIRAMMESEPEQLLGFHELDQPNRSFASPSCTFYSGTKVLAEEALQKSEIYMWRFHLPFTEVDDPNNFLSQVQDGFKFNDVLTSVSHLDECIGACLELWERRAAFGIYNVVNPGPVRMRDVIQMLPRFLKSARRLQLFVFDQDATVNGHSQADANCILDVKKLLSTGIKLEPASAALERALKRWVLPSDDALDHQG